LRKGVAHHGWVMLSVDERDHGRAVHRRIVAGGS
jgi:hypothetical protein